MIRAEKIIRKSVSGTIETWRIYYRTPMRSGHEDFSSRDKATAFATEILSELLEIEGI